MTIVSARELERGKEKARDMFVYVLAYKMSCIRDPTWILQHKVDFDPRILKNPKKVKKMDPALFKSADLWKRKQT